MRFSAPPSDVADQNPHDGCHRLHHHSRDSGHLCDLSSQGADTVPIVCIVFFVQVGSSSDLSLSLSLSVTVTGQDEEI